MRGCPIRLASYAGIRYECDYLWVIDGNFRVGSGVVGNPSYRAVRIDTVVKKADILASSGSCHHLEDLSKEIAVNAAADLILVGRTNPPDLSALSCDTLELEKPDP